MKIYNEKYAHTAKIAIIKGNIKGLVDLTKYSKMLKANNIKPSEVIYISLFDKSLGQTLAVADLRIAMIELEEFLKTSGVNILIDEVNYRDKKGKHHTSNIFGKIFGKDVKLWGQNGILEAKIGEVKVKMIAGWRGDSVEREMVKKGVVDSEFVVDFDQANIEIIKDGNRAKEVFRKLYNEEDEITFDTETNSLRWEMIGSKLLTIQFTGMKDKNTSYVMFIDHKDVQTTNNMKEVCSKGTQWLLESGKKIWIHNANFDLLWTKQHLCPNLDFYNVNSYDTMLIYHFLTNTYKDVPLGLKESAFVNKVASDWETALDIEKAIICREHKIKKDDFSYELFDVDMLSRYAGLDTIVLAFYVDMLWERNENHPARAELDIINETWKGNWQNIMESIMWMIFYGTPFDLEECKSQLANQELEVDRKLQKILEHKDVEIATKQINKLNFKKAQVAYEKKCEEAKGKGKEFKGAKPDWEKGYYGSIRFDVGFKPSSDTHKRILLHEVLGLPIVKKTDTGLASVGSDVMEEYFKMKPDIEILQLFNEIALIEKELTTYLRPWIKLSETSFDGNLRSNFTPTTTSLRLRSRSPNLLNISSGGILKKCIKTMDDDLIYQADYGSLETHTMLFYHRDPVKLEMKRNGITDEHSVNAIIVDKALGNNQLSQYSMTSPEDLKEIKKKFPALRQSAKNLTFSQSYLGSFMSIAASFNVDKETALEIYNTYWDTYKGERAYFIAKVEEMSRKGYLVNYGKAPIITVGIDTDLNDKDNMSNIRTCWNSLGQSSAYATLRAMDKTMRQLRGEKVYYKPFLSVYDSIIYTNKTKDTSYINSVMNTYMTEPIMENQPYNLTVDFEVGKTYKAEEDLEGSIEDIEKVLAKFK